MKELKELMEIIMGCGFFVGGLSLGALLTMHDSGELRLYLWVTWTVNFLLGCGIGIIVLLSLI